MSFVSSSDMSTDVAYSAWKKCFEGEGLPLVTPQTCEEEWKTEMRLSKFHLNKASLWLKALEEDKIHEKKEGWMIQKSAVYVSMLKIQSADFFPTDFFDREKVHRFLAVSRLHDVLEKQGRDTAPGQIILTYIKSKNQFKVRFQNYNIGYTHDEYIVYLNRKQALHLLFLYSYFNLHPYNAFCRPLEEEKEEVSKKI